ncbi:helix-turn-helix domain-containing protein [Streptomyces sp. NBRC 110611]|uniref:helix-turn-helix domain-containing protein n=1 Tax=Streptomyces sp. NBRC 110611 TaxID=1621259 RepID=UPI000D157E11|nr:helix-turn-helix domain-containing protein [Streptomyces sp. NBRC 110611]
MTNWPSRRTLAEQPLTHDPRHRLLTTAEAAVVACVTPATVRKWVHRGYLRPIARYGNRNLYREDHVLRTERACRTRRRKQCY